jgi:hypothetical protein
MQGTTMELCLGSTCASAQMRQSAGMHMPGSVPSTDNKRPCLLYESVVVCLYACYLSSPRRRHAGRGSWLSSLPLHPTMAPS